MRKKKAALAARSYMSGHLAKYETDYQLLVLYHVSKFILKKKEGKGDTAEIYGKNHVIYRLWLLKCPLCTI